MMMITTMRMTTRRPATAPTISPRSGRIGINVSTVYWYKVNHPITESVQYCVNMKVSNDAGNINSFP